MANQPTNNSENAFKGQNEGAKEAKKLDYGKPARRMANNETPIDLGDSPGAPDSNGTQKTP